MCFAAWSKWNSRRAFLQRFKKAIRDHIAIYGRPDLLYSHISDLRRKWEDERCALQRGQDGVT